MHQILLSIFTIGLALPQIDAFITELTGCHHNGTTYADKSLVPTMEKCLSCLCKKRTLVCRLKVCPEMPMPPPRGCVIVEKKNICCPYLSCARLNLIYRGPTTRRIIAYLDHYERESIDRVVNENVLQRRSDDSDTDLFVCVKNGTVYKSGSAMSSSSLCTYCYCIGGTEKCVRPKCMLPVDGCKPIFVDSNCCPVRYDCSAKPLGKSSQESRYRKAGNKHYLRLSQHLQRTHSCNIGKQSYVEGQKMPSENGRPCDICFCIRGCRKCAPKKCSPALKNCIPVVPKGQCCPSSYDCGLQRDYSRRQNSRQFNLFSLIFGPEEGEGNVTEAFDLPPDRHPQIHAENKVIAVTTEKSLFDTIRESLELIDQNDDILTDDSFIAPTTKLPPNNRTTNNANFSDPTLRPFEVSAETESKTTSPNDNISWVDLLLSEEADFDRKKDQFTTMSPLDDRQTTTTNEFDDFSGSGATIDVGELEQNQETTYSIADDDLYEIKTGENTIHVEDNGSGDDLGSTHNNHVDETTLQSISWTTDTNSFLHTLKNNGSTDGGDDNLDKEDGDKNSFFSVLFDGLSTIFKEDIESSFDNSTFSSSSQLLDSSNTTNVWNENVYTMATTTPPPPPPKTTTTTTTPTTTPTTTTKPPTTTPTTITIGTITAFSLNKSETDVPKISQIPKLTTTMNSTKIPVDVHMKPSNFMPLKINNLPTMQIPTAGNAQTNITNLLFKTLPPIHQTSPKPLSKESSAKIPIKPVFIKTIPTILDSVRFDSAEPTLPPSLPNLKIIPFLPADAVKTDRKQLLYEFYKHNNLKKNSNNHQSKNPVLSSKTPAIVDGHWDMPLYNKNSKIDFELYDEASNYPAITEPYSVYPDVEESNKAEYIYKFNVEGPLPLITSLSSSISLPVGGVSDPSTLAAFAKFDYNSNQKQSSGFSPPTKTEGGFIPKDMVTVPNVDRQFIIDITTPTYTTKVIEITTADPFKDVIRTESPPDLLTLIEDKEKRLTSSEIPPSDKDMIHITTDVPSNYSEYVEFHSFPNYSSNDFSNDLNIKRNVTAVQGSFSVQLNPKKSNENHNEKDTKRIPNIFLNEVNNETINLPAQPQLLKTLFQEQQNVTSEGSSSIDLNRKELFTLQPATKFTTTNPLPKAPFDKLPFMNASIEVRPNLNLDQNAMMDKPKHKNLPNKFDGLAPAFESFPAGVRKSTDGYDKSPPSSTSASVETSSLVSHHQVSANNIDPIGLLKLAGCNIYGRMYRVGRIISELSNPCLECKCTEVGVKCTKLYC